MPKLIIVKRDGSEHEVEASTGQNVMEAIRDAGFDELMAICGGGMSCATCHVYVDPAFAEKFAPAGEFEQELLESSDHMTAQSRLSCQLPFTEDVENLRVVIAPED